MIVEEVVAENKPAKKANHYVDNPTLYALIVEFQAKVNAAKEAGTPPPQIPDSIGKSIKAIADNLAKRPNFRNYSFINEMIGLGIQNCIGGVYQFKTDKYDKPFAYFTQICWWAFVEVIKEEKSEQEGKMSMMLDPTLRGFDVGFQDADMFIDRMELQTFLQNGK